MYSVETNKHIFNFVTLGSHTILVFSTPNVFAHYNVRKHSHFQTPLENPSVQTHFVFVCCHHKRLCIFGPKGVIQIQYLASSCVVNGATAKCYTHRFAGPWQLSQSRNTYVKTNKLVAKLSVYRHHSSIGDTNETLCRVEPQLSH